MESSKNMELCPNAPFRYATLVAKVYLETSYISACVATRTDAACVYRRQVSEEWWNNQRRHHELFISAEVIAELSDPEYPNSPAALKWIDGVPLLGLTEDVAGLATLLVRERVMPGPVAGDAVHVAAATVFSIEYMLSWNVRHLANVNKLEHLRVICRRAGYVPPLIVTPDLLWED